VAIQIVIDGYNVIGGERGLRGDLEGKRNQLIQQLHDYRERKGYPITVVFDGWRSGWMREGQEEIGGITVIFSRQGEKADSVIERLARELGSGCVVVTSDQEVRRAVEASDAAAIYSGEFRAKLKSPDVETFPDEDQLPTHPTSPAVHQQGKRGNPRKLSKIARRRWERLKKL